MRENLKNIRIGETNINSFGSKYEIIDYTNNINLIVKFDNGYIKKCTYDEFKKGTIKSLYDKSVYGVGYLGEGAYLLRIDGKVTKCYESWKGMFRRCYSEESKIKRPTYKGCTVDSEWHNFQNFAKWYDDNYYEVDDEQMELDKDILHKGNKIYSPKNCIFVPHNINTLFIKSNSSRGNLPLGVSKPKGMNKYISQCREGNSNHDKSKI